MAAAKQRRRKPTDAAMLSRTAAVSGCRFTQRIGAIHRRGEEPDVEARPWLELRGTLEEPVGGTTDVRISLHPSEPLVIGAARPASIGAIVGMRPEMAVVISWAEREFDRLWTLALSGHLKFVYLQFTASRYGHGLVVNASFGNERQE